MADLGASLRGYLVANAGVLATVSNRIYPDVLPQEYSVKKTGGALTYTVINTIHDHLINGLSGMARSRVEFTSFASTRAGANLIAEAVRASGLVGFVGAMGSMRIESVMIDEGIQYGTEGPTDGTQEHRYLTIFDYLIAYQETV